MDEQEVRKIIRDELSVLLGTNSYIFQKNIQILDGRNIQVGRTTGTKIGTADDQKLGFYGVTPVVKQNAIDSPSGGAVVDGPARSAIDSIRTALQNIGIIKT